LGLEVIEVDRLADELHRAMLSGSAASLVVAVRGNHHHGKIRSTFFDLGEQLQTVHAGHVDV
jgi:hypothetical protein